MTKPQDSDVRKGSPSAAFSVSGSSLTAPLPGLAASAANRLPRWALIWLVLVYVSHGLFHRGPWKGDDVVGIALARSAAEHLLSGNFKVLLLPHLQDSIWTNSGPLWPIVQGLFMLPVYFWASLMQVPLPMGIVDDAGRAALLITMLAGFAAIWKTADRFARRREAQPIDPLGLGPRSEDFGKTLGDCAVLLTISCLGIVYPWHQSGVDAAVFLIQGLALWALATAPETPRRAALQLSGLLLALLLTHGAGLALAWVFIICLVFWFVLPYRMVARSFLPRWAGLTAVWAGLWMLLTWQAFDSALIASWWSQQFAQVALWGILGLEPSARAKLKLFFDESLWRLWPLWPIVFYGLWQNRHLQFSRAPHWTIPIIVLVVLLLLGLLGPAQWNFEAIGPVAALALIASFSLLSLSRVLVSLIDWFAVAVFSALALFIWLYWTALHTGIPEAFAARLPIVAPNLQAQFNLVETLIAFIASVAWIALVVWRIRKGSPRLWRPVVLSAGGLAMVWTLLMTLWLSAVDQIQGRELFARPLEEAWRLSAEKHFGKDVLLRAKNPQENVCVHIPASNTELQMIALTYTHLPVRMADSDCRWRLESGRLPSSFDRRPSGRFETQTQWRLIWQSRPGDERMRRDQFFLLERMD